MSRCIRTTIETAREIRAVLDTALGYPCECEPSCRVGGGIHCPCVDTLTSVRFRAIVGSADVLVLVPLEWLALLTAEQQALPEYDESVIPRGDTDVTVE